MEKLLFFFLLVSSFLPCHNSTGSRAQEYTRGMICPPPHPRGIDGPSSPRIFMKDRPSHISQLGSATNPTPVKQQGASFQDQE